VSVDQGYSKIPAIWENKGVKCFGERILKAMKAGENPGCFHQLHVALDLRVWRLGTLEELG
jgi:hypothetical protein